jgi:hypothetical protein
MNPATTARRWNGWYRPRSSRPWQLLAASDDYATCLRELRDAAPWEGPNQEILVSPRHRNPNARRVAH